MAAKQILGIDILNSVSGNIQADETFYFRSYLSFGGLISETWDTQSLDTTSSNYSGNWKSSQGSAVTFKNKTSGNSTSGSDSGLFSAFGKADGLKVSGTWSDVWSPTLQSNKKTLVWTYAGDTQTSADDYSYKLDYQSKYSDTTNAINSEIAKLSFSNNNWNYNYASTISGNSSTFTASGSVLLQDKNDKSSFAWGFNIVSYESQDAVRVVLSNIKFSLSEYSITMAKFSTILSNAEFGSLGQLTPENDIKLDDIKNNFVTFKELLVTGDNTITISSISGASVNAGAGNDKVIGGIGSDTMIAGAGKDALTGGKGNDTFVLKKSDYDFTSSKTVLADTITDFKYTATEKDAITLDGFGSFVSFQTIAAAKKAGSTANVIYESKTGNFWYNEDGDSALVGALLFANAKGISDSYWVAAGMLSM